ncbi:PREDICTED: coiled-coil domain-containing protein 74A-like isoform X2 [Gekko japonicus]|uniref:Coiled-coil domain-containing protein 74A-like isoform X2 n=1 Tax=Gekko japonicus TaxID=146911 RepID=A0ABM1KES0_GEKJA|nr:PREDICTED: coiled-coil domain-containing protein 74A-like isoform X2 [Gekko japonicus]
MQSGGLPGLGLLSRWGRTDGLERSVAFLQQQHAETLAQLHQEVERLKRQNKDLQYKLIMQPALQKHDSHSTIPSAKPCQSSSPVEKVDLSPKAANKEDSAKPVEKKQMSEELTDNMESAEEAATIVMQKDAETLHSVLETPAEMPPSRETEVCDRMTSPIPIPSPRQTKNGEVKIPAASSNPFLVNVLPSYMRKPPTLEECEVVIRQLWNVNHMQMQELMYLRSCLEDIHKTKRIPEDYMLTGKLGNQDTTRLPRVKNVPKKWILTPLPAAERAVLPALKQTLGNAFAERQKRAQAAQRNRLHRTVL